MAVKMIVRLTHLCSMLAGWTVLFLLFGSGEAVSSQTLAPDPSMWTISKEILFTDTGEPRTPEIALLMARLEARSGEGSPVSRKEFLALLKKPESHIVYSNTVLRYATPASITTQNKEHTDLSKRLLSEQNQKICIDFLRTHRKYLSRAEKRFHVNQQDIVGILTWESGLGKYTGNYRIFNVFLGQIVYLDLAQEVAVTRIIEKGEPDPMADSLVAAREQRRMTKRKADAINSLVALLRTAKKMRFDPLSVLGSWGGASGYVQFMPYNIKYAIDADGNGLNLQTWPDAIYSVANFLKVQGKYKQTGDRRRQAILAYNRDEEYAHGVIALADTIWQQYHHAKK
ncbi:MAG TPA: lytic murein transglycosylase [Bacteroidota bacterium]|nr:lytic murein transglycosylase [Bacteroidota bacterium]